MSSRVPSPKARVLVVARIGVALLVGALMLGAAELALRVFVNYDSKWNLRVGASKEFDPITQFRNKPHYRLRGGVTTNERGYLAPENLSFENPSNRLRIIFMGDSVTFLPPGDNHPVQLARLLSERGFRVEGLNAAVPGFASHNLRALFESEISEYDADVFIVYVGWNDLGQFGPEGLPYKRLQAGYEVSAVQSFLANIYLIRVSYAMQRVLRRYDTAFDAPLGDADRSLYDAYYPSHYYENLKAVLELAIERYPLVFVANLATLTSEDPDASQLERVHFPVGMEKNMRKLHQVVLGYNETVSRAASEVGVPMIDLYTAFQNDGARRLMTDSCHVSREGALLIAKTVLAAIEDSLPAPNTLHANPTQTLASGARP